MATQFSKRKIHVWYIKTELQGDSGFFKLSRETDICLKNQVLKSRVNFKNYCFYHSILIAKFVSFLNHSLTAQGSDLPFFTQENCYNYTSLSGILRIIALS